MVREIDGLPDGSAAELQVNAAVSSICFSV